MFLSVRELRSNKKDRKKRQFNDDSGIIVPRKKYKHDADTLPKSHQKDLSIEESIIRFHSDIDANDHVGNIDTLVDDADIDNKYDKVFTFAPGEGQHPLSLYQDKDA